MKKHRYDAKYDILYISLNKGKIVRTDMLCPDELRQVDYDISGKPLGVEFFMVKKGVDTTGLPEPSAIAEVIAHLELAVTEQVDRSDAN